MVLPPAFAEALANDSSLWRDFTAISRLRWPRFWNSLRALCAGSGRATGSGSHGRPAEVTPIPYDGWTCRSATLDLIEAGQHIPLDCVALLKSKAGSGRGGCGARWSRHRSRIRQWLPID